MRGWLRGLTLLVLLAPAPATAHDASLLPPPATAHEQGTDEDDNANERRTGVVKIIIGGVAVFYGGGLMATTARPDGTTGAALVLGGAIAGTGVWLIKSGLMDRRTRAPSAAVSLSVMRGGAAVGFMKSWWGGLATTPPNLAS